MPTQMTTWRQTCINTSATCRRPRTRTTWHGANAGRHPLIPLDPGRARFSRLPIHLMSFRHRVDDLLCARSILVGALVPCLLVFASWLVGWRHPQDVRHSRGDRVGQDHGEILQNLYNDPKISTTTNSMCCVAPMR